MRWAPIHPRQLMAIALTTLVLMVMLMLAAASNLSSLDLSLGSGSDGPAATSSLPAGGAEATSAREPVWVTDPLAPPLSTMSRPPAGN